MKKEKLHKSHALTGVRNEPKKKIITKMNTEDPYVTPQSDVSVLAEEMSQFSHLNFKELKKLYHRSCNISAIAGLLVLGGVVSVALIIFKPPGDQMNWIFPCLAAFYLLSAFGLIKRTSWGRVLGVIVCILSLINIPIGTIIGIFGLFALFGAPELFGNNRVLHKDLKKEFKEQKQRAKNR